MVVEEEEKEVALLRRDLRRGWDGVLSGLGMGLRGDGDEGCVYVVVWPCSQS